MKSSNLMKACSCSKNTTFNEAKQNILLSGDAELNSAWGGNYVYIHFYTNPKPENRQ